MSYRGMVVSDDATPTAFFVYGLERFFGEDADRAVRLMLRRSRPGGRCGAYLHIAEPGEGSEDAEPVGAPPEIDREKD
jgi:hypothetical protein